MDLQADDYESSDNPDAAGPIVDILTSLEDDDTPSSSSNSSSRTSSGLGASSSGRSDDTADSGRPRGPVRSASSKGRSALRKYIEGFDQATMIDTARVVSAEGAALVERQTTALFGDIKALTKQMQVRKHWMGCSCQLACLHYFSSESIST